MFGIVKGMGNIGVVDGSYGDVNLEKLGCGMGEWLG